MPTVLEPAYELWLEAYTLCFEITFEKFILYQVDFTHQPKIVGNRFNDFDTPKYYQSKELGMGIEIIRPEYAKHPITVKVYSKNTYRGQERNIGFCAMPIQDHDLEHTSTHGWLRINHKNEQMVFVEENHDLEKDVTQPAFQALYGFVLGYSLDGLIGEIRLKKTHPDNSTTTGRLMVQKFMNVMYVDLHIRSISKVLPRDRQVLKEARIAIECLIEINRLEAEQGTINPVVPPAEVEKEDVEIPTDEKAHTHYVYELADEEDNDDKIVYQWPMYYEGDMSEQKILEILKEGVVRYRKYKITRANIMAESATVEYMGIVAWPCANTGTGSLAEIFLSKPLIKEQEVIQHKGQGNGRVQPEHVQPGVVVTTHPEIEALVCNVPRPEMEEARKHIVQFVAKNREKDNKKDDRT